MQVDEITPAGPLYLPDAAGVLAPTTELFANDAPWLEDTGARLVHASVSNEVAEALHVQSLRFHHEVWYPRSKVTRSTHEAPIRSLQDAGS